ncbi:hydrogenase maturation factor HoxX-like [Branchiostoma lanceolatum]|uniref:hydrogenase maturation factor HoxX-like n=1 Tax=Branchiostoma lanceolatum TaxID=7740 RepID=UPI003453926A
MIRSPTMINLVAWRSMLHLQTRATRAAVTSSPHVPFSQKPSQKASQHPVRRLSQQASEFSPLPWVDFAAPDTGTKTTGKPRKITFLCNSFNGLSQRLYLELVSRGHHVMVHDNPRGEKMTQVVEVDQPDIVVCPFLTRRVPASLYNNPARPVLIVHPGIPGDEGPSSIDWALKEGATEWGVTVLQAAETMDAGDIWATCKFPVNRQETKSSLYGKEVTQAAVLTVLKAIDAWEQDVPPTPLDYSHPEVKGELKRKLTVEDRQVDWAQPAEDVARAVRACDSQPGALGGLRVVVQG